MKHIVGLNLDVVDRAIDDELVIKEAFVEGHLDKLNPDVDEPSMSSKVLKKRSSSSHELARTPCQAKVAPGNLRSSWPLLRRPGSRRQT